MGETNPTYPTMEVAVSCETLADLASGHERKNEGDIIHIGWPSTQIGLKERKRYLWLRIEGPEENEMFQFSSAVKVKDAIRYDKRRYCIPLERLAVVDPKFDPARARDLNDAYQPFLTVDAETGLYLINTPPLFVNGLIYDKEIGDFI